MDILKKLSELHKGIGAALSPLLDRLDLQHPPALMTPNRAISPEYQPSYVGSEPYYKQQVAKQQAHQNLRPPKQYEDGSFQSPERSDPRVLSRRHFEDGSSILRAVPTRNFPASSNPGQVDIAPYARPFEQRDDEQYVSADSPFESLRRLLGR